MIQHLTQQFACLPFDAASADFYGQTCCYLEKTGQPIGPYDVQIAAIALQNGLIVVTHNVAEYSRVPGLVIEDWMTP